jgi:hypothetical protein
MALAGTVPAVILTGWGGRREGSSDPEVVTVNYDLESIGLAILVGFSFGFGAIAQLIVGNRATHWLWLTGAAGWFVGGIAASEVIVGTMTAAEIQPIVGGLAFDEALLGGLVGGVLAVVATWLVARASGIERRAGGSTPPMPMAR